MAADMSETSDVAIIGYHGRFPGADSPREFWDNIGNGVDCIQRFSDEELRATGVQDGEIGDPRYVPAAPVLKDVECFDASFFGIAPREAELMDPQQRLLLEVGWAALEHAGYDPGTIRQPVGVFAGARTNTYLFSLIAHDEIVRSVGAFHLGLGNDLGFLTTRLSHVFNLTGPSCAVQTACSTSLVAVHLAVQSLRRGESSVALAGGVAVNVPHRVGYRAEDGGVLSPDGHCRVFDADARGTVFGSGVGVVVLKLLSRAVADGDCVHAVIKGTAVNNDGSLKASFTAPSVRGQVAVIQAALRDAGVAADSIGYVEAHGTGTLLGDAIEVRALTKAYRAETARTGFCALGSVKSNVGHLDAAAGMAGLIKVVESMREEILPPTLHYRAPNPQLSFDDSPFYVNTEVRPWPNSGGPRRAGVSAFGVGGTNAHLIVEEAPPREASIASRPWQLLVWSGNTSEAAATVGFNLARHLRETPDACLADVAFTLQTGRRRLPWRRALVCQNAASAASAIEAGALDAISDEDRSGEASVLFMFPGQGSQRPGMARELYEHERAFREPFDICADLLAGEFSLDLRGALYGDSPTAPLDETWLAQPAVFATEYALARLWESWGVRPAAMIGHSIGEFVAACLAGVLSLEDAVRLVAVRGRLMQEMAPGAMFAVALGAEALEPWLGADAWVSAVNAPDSCTVGGTIERVTELEHELQAAGHGLQRLRTSHAYHTPMMRAAAARFVEVVERVRFGSIRIPYVSTMTGDWATEALVRDPAYWGEQLHAPVQFGRAIDTLLREGSRLTLEVGPGQGLSRLIRRRGDATAFATLASAGQSDMSAMLKATGQLWTAGVDIDWRAVSGPEPRRRVPLPTYPFERHRYWIDRPSSGEAQAPAALPAARATKIADVGQWFWTPSWTLARIVDGGAAHPRRDQSWLVFADSYGVGSRIVAALQEAGADVIAVSQGDSWQQTSTDAFTIAPGDPNGYRLLAQALARDGRRAENILYSWGVVPPEHAPDTGAFFEAFQAAGLHGLVHVARELTEGTGWTTRHMYVVSNDAHRIERQDVPHPAKSTAVAFCRVLSQETDVRARFIDIAFGDVVEDPDATVGKIIRELDHETLHVVAHRGANRWRAQYEPLPIESDASAPFPLRSKGVYLITGGLGAVGQLIARYLAESCGARVVLTGRTAMPPREQWPSLIERTAESDPLVQKLIALTAIDAAGGEVRVVTADATDADQMRAAVDYCYRELGGLHGVIHGAGVTSGASLFRMVRDTSPEHCREQASPKALGLYAIEAALQGRAVDFVLAMSSNAAVLGGLGFLSYAAANAAMDAFVAARSGRESGTRWMSANWDHWPAETKKYLDVSTSMDDYAMTVEEARDATRIVMTQCARGQVVVSTGDLRSRLAVWVSESSSGPIGAAAAGYGQAPLNARPALQTPYVPPRTEYERRIAEAWAAFLGVTPVGVTDDFFELGGQSLLAVKMMAEVSRSLGVELPLRSLFEGPTVEQLARAAEELVGASGAVA